MIRFPGVASVSCSECKEGWYEFIDDALVVSRRNGEELPRPKGSKTPCWKCPKLSAEDQRDNPRPENAVELTVRGMKMWNYYNEVKCGFPPHDDTLTRHVCGQLHRMEQSIDREERKWKRN